MKNRIAFISDHASPLADLGSIDSGGQNVYVKELALGLAKRGHKIDIFTRRENRSIAEIVHLTSNIRVIHVFAGPREVIPKEELYAYMDDFTNYINHFIAREKIEYDLIHAHFWLSGMVAMALKKRLMIPFIITFHALGKVRREHQGEADKFPAEREQIEKEIMENANKIITECPNDFKDHKDLYQVMPEKLEIIPCGYNPVDFFPIDKQLAKEQVGLEKDCDYLLQLGRIVPRKGIDNVIEAFTKIHNKFPKLRLVIVGGDLAALESPGELNNLYQQVVAAKIADKVIFTGHKSRAELKYYYSASEIFITTPWYEPFGITPLESMACGTAVIGSHVGGISFTVRHGETGLLVAPRDSEALAKAINTLYMDKKMLKKMGQYAEQYVQNSFTWDKISEQVNELYKEVIPVSKQQQKITLLKRKFLDASRTFIRSAEVLPKQILAVANTICDVLLTGNKVLVCGNGGSAAESQHFVAELIGRFQIKERPGYAVLSLNTDTAVITAWGNDIGYEYIFQRQVQALGKAGDLLICLSTSGNSPNILNALVQANQQKMSTVNILGKDGGEASRHADYNLIVPSQDTARIQEIHLHIIHLLCELVENKIESARNQVNTIKKKSIKND